MRIQENKLDLNIVDISISLTEHLNEKVFATFYKMPTKYTYDYVVDKSSSITNLKGFKYISKESKHMYINKKTQKYNNHIIFEKLQYSPKVILTDVKIAPNIDTAYLLALFAVSDKLNDIKFVSDRFVYGERINNKKLVKKSFIILTKPEYLLNYFIEITKVNDTIFVNFYHYIIVQGKYVFNDIFLEFNNRKIESLNTPCVFSMPIISHKDIIFVKKLLDKYTGIKYVFNDL